MLKATAGWGAIMFSGGMQEEPHEPVVLHCRLQIRWLYSFLSDILLAVSSVRKHMLTSGFAYCPFAAQKKREKKKRPREK